MSEALDNRQLGQILIGRQRFRLEALPRYTVGDDGGDYERFIAGGGDMREHDDEIRTSGPELGTGKEATMAELAEHDSGTAARILAAARELVLKRGVKGLTVAEIAEKAHVGKGTAYLYWKTKEDLLLGLFTRDFLAEVEEEIDALTADPDIARPHRLCPRLAHKALARPFVRALQTGDADLLGALTRHPRAMELLDQLGPAGLIYTVLPVWRQHRLVRTDWPLDEQAYALQALMAGFLETATRTPVLRSVTVDAPQKVMAAAVSALLGPEEADPADVRAAAEEGLRLLREKRELVLATIATDQG